MLLISFLIGFNYNVLRATKDALVVTAPSSGAEALPFLKVWIIIPFAFLMTFLFTRLCNRLSRERVFYVMMSAFLGFFFIFAFVLYPFRDYLHPNALADRLQEALPIGYHGMVAVFRNWTFTAFYVMSEMWRTMILTVLFWGFANEVTSVKDARRFYTFFSIGANCSGILAGQVAVYLSRQTFNPNIPFGSDAWGQSLILLNTIIIIVGILCMGLFRLLHRWGFGYGSTSNAESKKDEPKIKMGMRKNFRYLAQSKYLILLAIIVFTYNISINLVEVIWKNQVKLLYPDPQQFNACMGQVLTYIGIISTITAIFVSGNVIRKLSWKSSAMITPYIILLTSIGFFSFLLFKNYGLGHVAALVGTTPLVIIVFFGSLQNCLARASKYTFFDATKELAFIPLSPESRLKGKAAIDGVGSRLGKSGGAVIHQALLILFGTLSASTPYVAVILFGVVGAWIYAARSLGNQFSYLASHHETLKVPDEDLKKEEEPAAVTT
jgi:AAA family ATP:ADP antiporter